MLFCFFQRRGNSRFSVLNWPSYMLKMTEIVQSHPVKDRRRPRTILQKIFLPCSGQWAETKNHILSWGTSLYMGHIRENPLLGIFFIDMSHLRMCKLFHEMLVLDPRMLTTLWQIPGGGWLNMPKCWYLAAVWSQLEIPVGCRGAEGSKTKSFIIWWSGT